MMKWWGWGSPDFEFPMKDKTELWPWVAKTLGLRETRSTPPVPRPSIRLPAPMRHEPLLSALRAALRPGQLADDEDQRLLHSYGKSFPDLFLVRRGVVKRAPDLVVFPEGHDDVESVVRLAREHGAVVVPFGGGTNIVGGVNPRETGRVVVSLDMGRMNRLLALDPESNTAVIEAGALGPKLEADLQAQGFSLGHFPDSFEYSSLGGWIATRSAGMQSDAYGKIEDMVVCLKMVTPSGTLVTRRVPACSSGPDLNRLAAGSEGVLGVITEATMRVHRTPEAKDYRGWLFPSFEEGVAAIRDLLEAGRPPSLIRLQDRFETQLAFHMKTPPAGLKGFVQRQVKKVLKMRGYGEPVIMIVGLEGDRTQVARLRRETRRLLKRRRGFDLGTGVGKTWSQDKFNLPYLRDYVMDRGVMVDVSETSTTWGNVLDLHAKTRAAVFAKFAADGHPGEGFIGCHLSHTYKTGACLYFTYAARQEPGLELEQYYSYKKLLTDAFMRHGGALTHHHAVGTEHRPWMEAEVSPAGLAALRALKRGLDPEGVMNPGKLIPEAADPFAGWVQSADGGPALPERVEALRR